jgi:dihydrolipoamide dehydrogenase
VELDRRNYIPVNDNMAVLSAGEIVPNLWAIGDATGKMMLAHAASAQGIIAVENIIGKNKKIDYLSIPAAAFTHPEVSYVGLTETAAKDLGKAEGFEVGVSKSYFKGNSKALAEGDVDGMAKVVYRKDTGEVLGVHIFGIHASDIIHEASFAIANRQSVYTLAHLVHAHPTLSEVLDEAYKRAA